MRLPALGRPDVRKIAAIEIFRSRRRQEAHNVSLIIPEAAALIDAVGCRVVGGKMHTGAAPGHEIGQRLAEQRSRDPRPRYAGAVIAKPSRPISGAPAALPK